MLTTMLVLCVVPALAIGCLVAWRIDVVRETRDLERQEARKEEA